MKNDSDHYRYERKYHIDGFNRNFVTSVVKRHPAMFNPIHSVRYINNIYLDTLDLSNYDDNVIGSAIRVKSRIRWYGDLVGDVNSAVLEIKIKKGTVGTKHLFPLSNFKMTESFSSKNVQNLLASSDIPDTVKYDHKNHIMALINRYERSYFLSADAKFRATIDSNLHYYDKRYNSSSLSSYYVDKGNIILELKYAMENEKIAHNITSCFPFRLTKNSKYVTGIDLFL